MSSKSGEIDENVPRNSPKSWQSILMFAAIFAVIIRGSLAVGGVREVLRIAADRGRLQFLNVSADPTERHTLWTQLIGGMFVYCSIYAVNQVQRRGDKLVKLHMAQGKGQSNPELLHTSSCKFAM